MAKFASPERQASAVIRNLRGSVIRSVRTAHNFQQALSQVAKSDLCGKSLRSMTPERAILYLEQRGQEVGQKALDMERQAIQKMMQHVTCQLQPQKTLPVIKSELAQTLDSRVYSPDQVSLVQAAQTEKNALSTEIAYAAGLRAHELLTLQKVTNQPPDPRPALDSKFLGLSGEKYTVQGKGGLTREVILPSSLASRLESLRLDSPQRYTDRGVFYQQHYAINGGNRWSSSFTSASERSLGWSTGAHGLRHSYAQERMNSLQVNHGLNRDQSLETVSQEMGHFRPSITEVYLR